jgi:alkylated DNA repair dioxygenase AlkB
MTSLVLTVDDFARDPCKLASLGAGDTRLLLDVLPDELAARALAELQSTVQWSTMQNRGGPVPRLVSMQGAFTADGCEPVYRHPADEQPRMVPFTPICDELRRAVEARLGQTTPSFNHALVQWYRSGRDSISEHADKTLDVQPASVIVNLSLGASRVMILKSKERSDGTRKVVQKIDLPHNSLFVLGLATNAKFTHQIKADRRDSKFKRADETRDAGHRVSLTFRVIHTFRRPVDGRLFGGGARFKTLAALDAANSPVVDDAQEMLHAFSAENRQSEFDWAAAYGGGFDALNFRVLNAEQQRLRCQEAQASIQAHVEGDEGDDEGENDRDDEDDD